MVFVCIGKRFTYRHNDSSMEKNLERATKLAEVQGRNSLLLKVFLNARSKVN
jgi:hypothetical protein